MQYEIVFKGDTWFMLYLPSSNCSCYSKCPAEGGSLYSFDCSTSTHDRNAKNKVQDIHIHANKAKAKKQYNIT